MSFQAPSKIVGRGEGLTGLRNRGKKKKDHVQARLKGGRNARFKRHISLKEGGGEREIGATRFTGLQRNPEARSEGKIAGLIKSIGGKGRTWAPRMGCGNDQGRQRKVSWMSRINETVAR